MVVHYIAIFLSCNVYLMHLKILVFLSFHTFADNINRIFIFDSQALVTVGSWNYKSITNQLGRRDFYTDECLRKASGGLEGARIDLYQIHTYDNWVEYPHDAPFKVSSMVS